MSQLVRNTSPRLQKGGSASPGGGEEEMKAGGDLRVVRRVFLFLSITLLSLWLQMNPLWVLLKRRFWLAGLGGA